MPLSRFGKGIMVTIVIDLREEITSNRLLEH